MIRHLLKKNKLGKASSFVEADEIFLDSKNLPGFDRQQFEGRIEKPISKRAVIFLGIMFTIIIGSFSVRLGYLQIEKGEAYYKRSENNVLEKDIIFADRGIIYDRNRVELAWNKKTEGSVETPEGERTFPIRAYRTGGFSHVLGYVAYPAKDKSGNFWQSEFTGKDGLEKIYDLHVKGENGLKILETDAQGNLHSENIVNAPKRGADLVTTIDSRIQGEMFKLIQDLSEAHSFTGGAGVIMDVHSGEIIASTSFPEYDSEVLSLGKESAKIKHYLTDKRKALLDRTMSGLYTPGSIVKPFFALGALNEKIIDPAKQILSTGSISIPNPYSPGDKTVFKDWKAHGWVDMRHAIAVSSDVYFYEIGGGFEGQKGLGIARLEQYAKLFHIGEKTGVDLPDEKEGVIPSPEWKAKVFPGDPWRIGNTYHTSIGQYGFQVTPLQMTRATAAIANSGTLPTPHFVLGDIEKESQQVKIELPEEYFVIVREGMRMTVTEGTAAALNMPYVKAAAKTGTAQLGVAKNRVNSWIIGYFPYDNPKYAFTVMMESGPSTGSVGASSIMRGLFEWMSVHTPEYFQ